MCDVPALGAGQTRAAALKTAAAVTVGGLMFVHGVGLSTPVAAPLTGRDALVRAYDGILNAQFEQAAETLRECRGAPPAACRVLEAARRWWRIQLDPNDRSRDTAFSASVTEAIDAAEAWVARAPRDPEAWFYLGGAYGARVQFRVLRGERLAAARDGKRIKESLEAALRLDPTLEDAHFGIGLYQYYADVAPAAAKVLRWLLLLPGGNRSEGLARMVRTAGSGQLLRGEADFQLHIIYLWYEHEFAKALELVERLQTRYPGNPLFPQTIAEIHDVYLHDATSSVRAYSALLERARARTVSEPAMAEVRARLGLALQLERTFESDRALEQAQWVIARRPLAPHSALATAYVAAAQALLHLGRPDEAARMLDSAQAAIPAGDPLDIAAQVRVARRTKVDPPRAGAYRQALAAYRAFELGRHAEAEEGFARAIASDPRDMVTRYRHGLLLSAQGHTARARQEWELVAGAGATTPPTIFAEACLVLAGVVERSGELAYARTLYGRAAQTFGAFADSRRRAQSAAARLASVR